MGVLPYGLTPTFPDPAAAPIPIASRKTVCYQGRVLTQGRCATKSRVGSARGKRSVWELQPALGGALRLLALVYLAGGASAASAAPIFDVNCNNIPRPIETDRRYPGQQCVDYKLNDNSCVPLVEFPPLRPCDDYVAPGPGMPATCSPNLAPDRDGDGLGDACDNCPAVANNTQDDNRDYLLCPDGRAHLPNNPCPDGRGDACDNCPDVYNPDQKDDNLNGIGDACDFCISGVAARLPNYMDPRQTGVDSDADGISDLCDNCPAVSNRDQADADGNAIGDACELCNEEVRAALPPGFKDARQPDADEDGIPDKCDNCPTVANSDQLDLDRNGYGDACQPVARGGCNPSTMAGAGTARPGAAGGAALAAGLLALLGLRSRRRQ